MKLELIIRGSDGYGEGKSLHSYPGRIPTVIILEALSVAFIESETAILTHMCNPDLGEQRKRCRNPYMHPFHMPFRLTKKDWLVCWAH
jgi:hypothetical protein